MLLAQLTQLLPTAPDAAATLQSFQIMQSTQERLIAIATTIVVSLAAAVVALARQLFQRDAYWIDILKAKEAGHEALLQAARAEAMKAHADHAQTAVRSAEAVNQATQQMLGALDIAERATEAAEAAEDAAEEARVSADGMNSPPPDSTPTPPPKTRRAPR